MAEPGIACIFGCHLTEDGQTVKKQKRINSGDQKYRESQKHWNSVFRRHLSVSTFVLSPRIVLQNRCSTQASESWTRWRRRSPSFARPSAMVYLAPTQPPWLVAEALETEVIPAKFAVILAAHSRNVCEDRAALTPEKRLGQGIHT